MRGSALQPALAYFALVFAVGFALGAVRTAWLEPRLGARAAELLELPLMVFASWAIARWLLGRDVVACPPRRRLLVGGIALLCMLAAELGLGMALRGRSPRELLLERDPVAGPAYLMALVLFGLMPWWLGRREE